MTHIVTPTHKNIAEMNYWKKCFSKENENFGNTHYRKIMLNIAEKDTDTFLENCIIADFGCGPRGSLTWITVPCVRIGIDLLIDEYFKDFCKNMQNHNMIYVKSTEANIPIQTAYCDVIFTLNSLDHIESLVLFDEISRILKPGGYLYGSFNLHEEASECEPQTFDVRMIHNLLAQNFIIKSQRIANKSYESTYKNFYDLNLQNEDANKEQILWIIAQKIDEEIVNISEISEKTTLTPYMDKIRTQFKDKNES